MSTYRDKDTIDSADGWVDLTAANSGKVSFEANFPSSSGQSLVVVQNDGSEGMDVRVRRRPIDDADAHIDAQWWSYQTGTVASDQEPYQLRLERAEGLEYKIEVQAQTGATSASAWVLPVAGEAS